MANSGTEMILGLLSILMVAWAMRTLNRYWLKPRRLERALRAQGLQGTSYRFLTGDLKEKARLDNEARSKPMPTRSHDIIPCWKERDYYLGS